MSSAPGMCQAYPAYTSGAPEDVSTALHGSGEGSLCTKVHAAPASPCIETHLNRRRYNSRTVTGDRLTIAAAIVLIAFRAYSIDTHAGACYRGLAFEF